MDAKILDQVAINLVGNCKIMVVDLNIEGYSRYRISNISFTPQAIICAKKREPPVDGEISAVLIKPMSTNYYMEVNEWNIDSVVVRSNFSGHWYFIILG